MLKTSDTDVEKSKTGDGGHRPDETLSRDELLAVICGQDRNVSAQAKRIRDLEQALREANDQIKRWNGAHKRAALDYFDLVSTMPQGSGGIPLWLDDVVEYDSERWQIVAVSHKGKVAIRRESATGGKGAKWLDDASQLELAEGGAREHADVVSRLREAGFAPIDADAGSCPECACTGEIRDESTSADGAEFWRQQYGASQMEVMRLTQQYGDACDEIDLLKIAIDGQQRDEELAKVTAERDNARNMAVALEGEVARLKVRMGEVSDCLRAAERTRDRALGAWDTVAVAAEGASNLLDHVASSLGLEISFANSMALLADALMHAVGAARRSMGARNAREFAELTEQPRQA